MCYVLLFFEKKAVAKPVVLESTGRQTTTHVRIFCEGFVTMDWPAFYLEAAEYAKADSVAG
jgi:hypothetical protein